MKKETAKDILAFNSTEVKDVCARVSVIGVGFIFGGFKR